MKKYFKIYLEFDRDNCHDIIDKTIKQNGKGYVCVVDGNVLANASKNTLYRNIINKSLVNICDGSSIALFASKIYKMPFSCYTGPEIFAKYLQSNLKQYLLGNTESILSQLKNHIIESGYSIDQFKYEPLPFRNVEDFDYISIAKNINDFSPDIIWVSLGAPKQEVFISKLNVYIDHGVLFAIGGAFNLYLGEKNNTRAPKILRQMHLEWLYRVIREPIRIGSRALYYLIMLPKIIIQEYKQSKNNEEKIL